MSVMCLAPYVSMQIGITDDFDYLEMAPLPSKAVAE